MADQKPTTDTNDTDELELGAKAGGSRVQDAAAREERRLEAASELVEYLAELGKDEAVLQRLQKKIAELMRIVADIRKEPSNSDEETEADERVRALASQVDDLQRRLPDIRSSLVLGKPVGARIEIAPGSSLSVATVATEDADTAAWVNEPPQPLLNESDRIRLEKQMNDVETLQNITIGTIGEVNSAELEKEWVAIDTEARRWHALLKNKVDSLKSYKEDVEKVVATLHERAFALSERADELKREVERLDEYEEIIVALDKSLRDIPSGELHERQARLQERLAAMRQKITTQPLKETLDEMYVLANEIGTLSDDVTRALEAPKPKPETPADITIVERAEEEPSGKNAVTEAVRGQYPLLPWKYSKALRNFFIQDLATNRAYEVLHIGADGKDMEVGYKDDDGFYVHVSVTPDDTLDALRERLDRALSKEDEIEEIAEVAPPADIPEPDAEDPMFAPEALQEELENGPAVMPEDARQEAEAAREAAERMLKGLQENNAALADELPVDFDDVIIAPEPDKRKPRGKAAVRAKRLAAAALLAGGISAAVLYGRNTDWRPKWNEVQKAAKKFAKWSKAHVFGAWDEESVREEAAEPPANEALPAVLPPSPESGENLIKDLTVERSELAILFREWKKQKIDSVRALGDEAETVKRVLSGKVRDFLAKKGGAQIALGEPKDMAGLSREETLAKLAVEFVDGQVIESLKREKSLSDAEKVFLASASAMAVMPESNSLKVRLDGQDFFVVIPGRFSVNKMGQLIVTEPGKEPVPSVVEWDGRHLRFYPGEPEIGEYGAGEARPLLRKPGATPILELTPGQAS